MCHIFYVFIYAQKIEKDTLSATEKLKDITVHYNKWEQNLNEVPNRIVKISLKNLRMQNPQTMADALGTTGDVFIQKSQLGGGSPMIRGFATNRVLLVVDGVRMNNAIYRSGNLQNILSLDALSIDDAEIIFGQDL
jgi:hemoglobin/transferrin/lactoferrin receptor protein